MNFDAEAVVVSQSLYRAGFRAIIAGNFAKSFRKFHNFERLGNSGKTRQGSVDITFR